MLTTRPENRKARELYVGNLTVGLVTAAMLKELFSAPLMTLPGSDKGDGVPPVVDARVDLGGKFAFVEFRDEELATTALSLFNTMELCGRPMQVARPTGYVPTEQSGVPPQPMLMPGQALGALAAAGGGAAPPPPPPPPTATRLLRLENLMGADALADDAEYAECVEDIRGECERFGAIESFRIPRMQDLQGHTEADVGKCFVLYQEVKAASAAYEQLNGRDFDGNKVQAVFLPDP